MHKEKIEQMITDLLVKIHQNLANGNPPNLSEVDLLNSLENMLRFRIKYEKEIKNK